MPLTVEIGNLQPCGMPGSLSYVVTLTGDDSVLQSIITVKSIALPQAEVPAYYTTIPQGCSDLTQQDLTHWVCPVMTGCDPGSVILAWPIQQLPNARGDLAVPQNLGG